MSKAIIKHIDNIVYNAQELCYTLAIKDIPIASIDIILNTARIPQPQEATIEYREAIDSVNNVIDVIQRQATTLCTHSNSNSINVIVFSLLIDLVKQHI